MVEAIGSGERLGGGLTPLQRSYPSWRLNVTLAPEYGEKLARIAARTHVREGTIASSLLSQAIDDADVDAAQIVALLDRIPGAWARVEAGIADARAGRTIPFDSER